MMFAARRNSRKKERHPMTQKKHARINELTHLPREQALTKEEEV